ncbi:protein kinase [Streptomyces sp. NPDC048664]|uniref:protein kinase domain-containing protein n=1 Tax=Streptomyces sp. NPDC048664 TaxID=3154505 RepID=UPI0034317E04
MASGSPQQGVGRVIADRYLLLRRLGSGAMGHVWLAHDERLACEVALKEIAFRDQAEAARERATRVARARAEARHAAGLRGHPHVVTVHDVLEHEGLPWIVMEYVAGALDLRARVLRRGAPDPAECARIGLAVLDALTEGHERGVMHRDVKPANILLAPDRGEAPYARVLLTDYGISVRPGADDTRHTLTSALVGTPGYLAPERAMGGPPTAAADLFSLGCTLYFAVEGHGPFERDTQLAEVTAAVLDEPRPPLRAGALGPLIAAMLVKDPAGRITAEDAAAALASIAAPRPRRTAPWPFSGPRPRRLPPVAGSPPRRGTARGAGPGASRALFAGSAPGPGPSTPATARPRPAWARPEPPLAPRAWHARRWPRALGACALGLVLALGGVWYAEAQRAPGATAPPYGDAVLPARPLRAGECVVADWPDRPFEGGAGPRLTVTPGCTGTPPDGQVMALVTSTSAAQARERGAAACERRTREVRKRLADVRSYAVVPTDAGFAAAGRRTACLLLGAHGPVYGPLDAFRRAGMAFTDTADMQKGDCLAVPSQRIAHLVPCSGAHDQRVLGFTRLAARTTLAEARGLSDAACARDVPPREHGWDPARYEAASWTGRGAWSFGTHLVVCTVRARNGGTMGRDEP